MMTPMKSMGSGIKTKSAIAKKLARKMTTYKKGSNRTSTKKGSIRNSISPNKRKNSSVQSLSKNDGNIKLSRFGAGSQVDINSSRKISTNSSIINPTGKETTKQKEVKFQRIRTENS